MAQLAEVATTKDFLVVRQKAISGRTAKFGVTT